MGKRKRADPAMSKPPKSKKPSTSLSHLSKFLFWTDTHGASLEKVISSIPEHFGQVIATLAMFVLGLTIRGEWLLFAAYFFKYMGSGGDSNYVEDTDQMITSVSDWFAVRFAGYFTILFWSVLISYLAYFGIGGFLHWYYYVQRKDRAAEWKCQPNTWLTPEVERHEIILGSSSLVIGSVLSAAISSYIINGGTLTKVYFSVEEHGYMWLLVQIPITYLYQDYQAYIHHRLYHTPWLYKNFHKLHHTYKQPTAFSVTAIHPVEFVHMQMILISPIVLWPLYWVNLVVLLAYIYYHGIVDHSGINFKRAWWQPWQPDCIFHDNHHQYFHVNFGFNMELWDKLHGTERRKDRIYNEDIFYGYGKQLNEATDAERNQDKLQRISENPLAHANNKNEFI